jgi:hypothetical protein
MPLPEQPAPDQPANLEPGAGAAVRVTELSEVKLAKQVNPHLIPAGELVTAPVPVPDLVTVRAYVCRNVAVTECTAFIKRWQAPIPVQSPDHPANFDPASGIAVSVTSESLANVDEQTAPQSIPEGEEVTAPLPEPIPRTLTVAGVVRVKKRGDGDEDNEPV